MHSDLIFSNIIDLLEAATPAAKQHIIQFSVNIIDQRDHDEFAKKLMYVICCVMFCVTKIIFFDLIIK